MAKPYTKSNNVKSDIAVANTWQRGTDTSIVLTSGADFDAGGGYIRIGDATSFAIMEYTGKTSNTLTGLTACTIGVVVSVGDETKTWPAATEVKRVSVGEDFALDNLPGMPVQETSVGVVASAKILNFLDMNVEDGGSGLANIYVDRASPCAGRLTLTTAVPVTMSDVTAATTLYFTPYNGRKVGLFDGTRWQDYNLSEIHIHLTEVLSCVVANGDATVTTPANGTRGLVVGQEVTGAHVPGATTVLSITDSTHFEMSANASGDATEDLTFKLPASKVYDVFLWNDAGTLRLEWGPVWTSSTARATDIAWQDGIYVKNGATTRRYLGTICTTATAGQTEDSISKRFVWNYYNRKQRSLYYGMAAGTHTWDTATYRQWNADTAARVDFVIGVWDDFTLSAYARGSIYTSDAAKSTYLGMGLDATNAAVANASTVHTVASTYQTAYFADAASTSLLGAHYFSGVELQTTVGTGTYSGCRLYFLIFG
jgi:hypothetical protein